LQGEKRERFQKTLQDYVASQGLAYCVIQDDIGDPLLVLDPYKIVPDIPHDVSLRSLATIGLEQQSFHTDSGSTQIYEFAKGLFDGAQRTAVIRLGLKTPSVSLFSLERIDLVLTFAFFLFSMVPFACYGITRAAEPLRRLGINIDGFTGRSRNAEVDWEENKSFDTLIKSLETSLTLFREKYQKLQEAHCQLQTEQGLRNYERKKFTQILDSLDHGIIMTDVQDNIFNVNAYVLNLLKKKKEDVVGRPILEILEQEDLMPFLSSLGDNGHCGDKRSQETAFPATRPNEVFELTASCLKDHEGSITGHLFLLYDVTHEKSAEKAKHTFIAHVAHELRAPLTTIKCYNEMLMEGDVEDPETKKEFSNTINEETDRLAHLIENLLNISKIELGSMQVEKGLVKTSWLYKDCLAAVSGPAKKKHITIQKKPPDKWPSLMGDKELLKVALINVLGNAVKYTPEHKSIGFSMEEHDDFVVFDVADQGYGVSKVDLPKIFTPFYRADDEHIKDQPGSGLGLAMTADIIRLHNGEIKVKSTPGKGTHFRIQLPKGSHQLADQ
jgi:PAS domain S-box-containing protein